MRISDWSSDVCSSDLDARAVFPPVISGETVEREQVGILQVHRPRILVRDRQVAGAGRPDELDSRRERLDAAKRRTGKRSAYVDRRRPGGKPSPAAPDRARRRTDGPDAGPDHQNADPLRAADARIEHPPEDRKSGVKGKRLSVRVDLGGR